MMHATEELRTALRRLGNPHRAEVSQRFFKTGPGEYGAGDVFLGVSVPEVRSLAKGHHALASDGATDLLCSPIHEERLLALHIFVYAYPKSDAAARGQIYDTYLGHTRWINNWDLVDCSAPQIVGAHLLDRDRSVLDRLAGSPSLWERRIAVIATLQFIRRGEFADTLRLAARLLRDREDLMHKAVGWMLREVGKRDGEAERAFLRANYKHMPRTMLRYAIERFPEAERQRFLKGMV